MSVATFAYALILRSPIAERELMLLLSPERRTETEAVLERIRGMSPTDVRVQLKQIRDDQLTRQRETIRRRTGLNLERVAPELRAWLTRSF